MANTVFDLGFAFKRSNADPIDISSTWSTLEEAENYAKGLITEKGAKYAGQIISVINNEIAEAYIIAEDGTLKPCGGGTVTNIEGDGNISATTIDNKVKLTLECISNPQIVIE